MTKKKDDPQPAGRKSTFKLEYCDLLIRHAKGGGSLESFGSLIPCSVQTLYNWLEKHPEFVEARKAGMAHMHAFYENLGKAMASGNLRRIVSEKPAITKDKDGNEVIARDPVTKEILYERTYEPATPAQSTFIFMTKNLLGWRDKKDIQVGGTPNADPIKIESSFSHLTPDEVEKMYKEMKMRIASEIIGERD